MSIRTGLIFGLLFIFSMINLATMMHSSRNGHVGVGVTTVRFLSAAIAVLVFFSIVSCVSDFFSMIPPIEVYRGNTSLEVTQVITPDGITSSDTIVVWKDGVGPLIR